ncbi:phosphatidylinositol-specific phospholipase C/glycerophosphodiester phosphodiesterase family protein [Streptomyces zagrosensis]|uniref:Altered inheritance of mitochondria protein 6 n=1 Tax=Streptomyces zagrosensis TaxID=1042984 RepID=A0A7W9QCL7_9ACTN|nr:phosphatidylinositol-specific phospholipase C/glycerophosphodiester phosphodiesterase family protein [Streptomyces zagrosensis]MBB5937793.1 glycerophosphoryl diester phosphodiesterase [Streptomyces zagrosensis]
MVHSTRRAFVVTIGAALAGGVAAPAYAQARGGHPGGAGVSPLRQAHAHNDYEHARPLHDALSHGFTSVEADIWLVDGQLLVAHDEVDLDPTRTLERLYLDPLLRRVRANGGRVYRGHRLPLQLLIDIKNQGDATYRVLSKRLHRYRSMLSFTAGGRVFEGAVTPVISGDRAARPAMEAERVRHAFYDGRLDDLGTGVPASFIPLISSNWTQSFTWQGVGAMPVHERARLRQLVDAAHAQRQRVRFWATPDLPGPAREAVWRELFAAGVDHLNTDDLPGLEAFLRAAR